LCVKKKICVAFSTTPGYATVGISQLNNIFFYWPTAYLFLSLFVSLYFFAAT